MITDIKMIIYFYGGFLLLLVLGVFLNNKEKKPVKDCDGFSVLFIILIFSAIFCNLWYIIKYGTQESCNNICNCVEKKGKNNENYICQFGKCHDKKDFFITNLGWIWIGVGNALIYVITKIMLFSSDHDKSFQTASIYHVFFYIYILSFITAFVFMIINMNNKTGNDNSRKKAIAKICSKCSK